MSQLLVDFTTSVDGYASGECSAGFWGLEYRPCVLERPPLDPTA